MANGFTSAIPIGLKDTHSLAVIHLHQAINLSVCTPKTWVLRPKSMIDRRRKPEKNPYSVDLVSDSEGKFNTKKAYEKRRM